MALHTCVPETEERTDVPWHCSSEGPWWKRWRIRLFGLSARELAENWDEVRRMQAVAAAESAEEDRRFDEWWGREGRAEFEARLADGHHCASCGAGPFPIENAEDCGMGDCPVDVLTGLPKSR